jgi:isoquinoline 1-oxidoreductase alpha subunit
MASYKLSVNDQKITVEVEPDTPLLWVLRDVVGLKGTKYGCGMSLCGACTVHLNGQPVRSCQTRIDALKKRDRITTIEAVGATPAGKAVQEAWIALQTPQCGYCQSGQVMAATALLNKNARPSDADIDDAMNGHLCRCGTYPRIRAAIHQAAEKLKASRSR